MEVEGLKRDQLQELIGGDIGNEEEEQNLLEEGIFATPSTTNEWSIKDNTGNTKKRRNSFKRIEASRIIERGKEIGVKRKGEESPETPKIREYKKLNVNMNDNNSTSNYPKTWYDQAFVKSSKTQRSPQRVPGESKEITGKMEKNIKDYTQTKERWLSVENEGRPNNEEYKEERINNANNINENKTESKIDRIESMLERVLEELGNKKEETRILEKTIDTLEKRMGTLEDKLYPKIGRIEESTENNRKEVEDLRRNIEKRYIQQKEKNEIIGKKMEMLRKVIDEKWDRVIIGQKKADSGDTLKEPGSDIRERKEQREYEWRMKELDWIVESKEREKKKKI